VKDGLYTITCIHSEENNKMQQFNTRRKIPTIALFAAGSLVVTGCATETGQGAVGGAALGAIAGALIGGKKGAAIGAAAGAALGAATGAYLKQRREQYASLEDMANEEIRIADMRNSTIARENDDLQEQLASLNTEIAALDADVERTAADKQKLQGEADSLKARIAALDTLIDKTQEDIKNQQTIVTHLRNNEKVAEADRLNTLLEQQRDVQLARLRATRADAAQTLSEVQAYI
jgi:outer membrane lipoprotein SlyB